MELEEKRINISNNIWLEKGIIPIKIDDTEYNELWNLHPKERREINFFNKTYKLPRWNQAYGVDYKFSGIIEKAKPITEQLQKYLDWANNNEIQHKRNGNLNGILINWYKNGEDYISWHSDNETELDPNSPIYTISLGSTRTFKIREKENHLNVTNFELNHNDFLIMGGKDFQKKYQHHLPKRKKCVDSRISITIRKFL